MLRAAKDLSSVHGAYACLACSKHRQFCAASAGWAARLHASQTKHKGPEQPYEYEPLCLKLLLQDNAVVTVGNGTVFKDNAASYGGGIGESNVPTIEFGHLYTACVSYMACCLRQNCVTMAM
jgi:hypothetical protein